MAMGRKNFGKEMSPDMLKKGKAKGKGKKKPLPFKPFAKKK